MGRNILWIINNYETLEHSCDSTLRMIQESILHGHDNHISDYLTLSNHNGRFEAIAQKVLEISNNRRKDEIILSKYCNVILDHYDIIIYRVDPPVDYSYINHLQIIYSFLNQTRKNLPFFINPIDQLLLYSEKYRHFDKFNIFPNTTISSNWSTLLTFGTSEKITVLKPINNAQNRGVMKLYWDKKKDIKENYLLLSQATNNFRIPIVLQEYLDVINEGEIRLWFANGKLKATAKKISKRHHFLFDIDNGDTLIPYKLTESESALAILISDYLISKKIFFAAVDLIANKVTDFNITSPGLIVEMEKVLGRNICEELIREFSNITLN
jgi:glutathione synthetase